MSDTYPQTQFYFYLATWPIALSFQYFYLSRRGRLGGVLVSAYLIGFFTMFWPGAFSTTQAFSDAETTANVYVGFEVATYALWAIIVGVFAIPRTRYKSGKESSLRINQQRYQASWVLDGRPAIYLFLGSVFWVVNTTIFANLPSITAVLTAGRNLPSLALCLFAWRFYRSGRPGAFYAVSLSAVIFPLLTVLTSGFIGFGVSMVALVGCFIAMFYKPRWHVWLAAICLAYTGLSFWVPYSMHRSGIREAVWGGMPYGDRFDSVLAAVRDFEFFSIADPKAQSALTDRFNQSSLVGAAMAFTPMVVPFEDGYTLYEAATAFVPRVLWPSKPATGGSGDYVSKHTGIAFAKGTSIGMGQVFELYINFGMWAVIVGHVLLGMLLSYLDSRIVRSLVEGDARSAEALLFVGLGVIQPGGSLAEIIGSMCGGAVLAMLVRYVVKWELSSRKIRSRATHW